MLLGLVLAQQGQDVEAVDMMRRARELDPLFPLIFANSAYVARVAGDLGSSIELARQAIAINPRFWVGYYQLGETQLVAGELDDAYESFSQADALSAGNSKAVAARAYVLARQGDRDGAIAALAELEAKASERYVPPYAFAAIYAGLGDTERTLEYLDRALAGRDVHLLGFGTEPMFDSLRNDPRFQSLLDRSGMAKTPGSQR
jgi:tetratricopeptide (TPR) repeat protein